MRKALIILALLFLIGCDKATTTINNTTTPTTITTTTSASTTTTTNPETTQSSTVTTTTTSTTTSETTTTTQAVTTTSVSSLKTEILPIYSSSYGTTNGNANNMGLVVYDVANQRHVYAVGANVYTYDPVSDETNLLFTLTDGGYVRNMCLSQEYLYFVSSNDLYMKKYNLSTEEITTVNEAETYFISRYDTYVYVDMLDPTYSVRGMKVFSNNNQTFYSAFGSGVQNLNVSGTKVFYNQADGTNIQVAGSTFSGKTTDVNLSEYEFTEIRELHLIKDSYSSGRTYAFIATNASYTALYIYNANTGLEQILSGEDIHSLNSDTYNLFYMNAGGIYKYNLETKETSLVVNVGVSSKYIYVVNHWIYYSNDTLSSLYRVDPDTQEVETLS